MPLVIKFKFKVENGIPITSSDDLVYYHIFK